MIKLSQYKVKFELNRLNRNGNLNQFNPKLSQIIKKEKNRYMV